MRVGKRMYRIQHIGFPCVVVEPGKGSRGFRCLGVGFRVLCSGVLDLGFTGFRFRV